MTSMMRKTIAGFAGRARAFRPARKGNVAMMFGIALVPIMIAAGVGLDFARGMMARSAMSEALDAAALAVGSTPNVTASQAQAIAQQYFNANYKGDPTYGSNPVLNAPQMNGQSVTLSASQQVHTTLLAVGGIPYLAISSSSTVVWGQSKLWVALVLDNTGSMTQTDSTGTSKLSALKTAAGQLITTLQNASSNVGDVQASIVPFSKLVNLGTGYVSSQAIDWSDWEAQPPGGTPSTSVGPGSSCPWSSGSNGFRCLQTPTGSSTTSTVPSSGLICPSPVSTYTASGSLAGKGGHHFNGCYNSTPTQTLTSTQVDSTPTTTKQNCSQAGSGTITCTNKSGYPSTGSTTSNTTTATTSGYSGNSGPTTTNSSSSSTSDGSKSCSTSHGVTTCTWTRTIVTTAVATTVTATGAAPYNHAWVINDHSTWTGCIEDRAQDYDTQDTSPNVGGGSGFPAANDDNCPPSTITPLPASWSSSQWTTLQSQITAMSANGSTNQTIGLQHGWQTLTPGTGPYDPPTLPSNTARYIILVSDGLNTQDRWYGDGSNQSASVDTRMANACTNAKADGMVIYTVFVDLNGTQGNSSVLQNCASDASKYYDLTTSGAIVTTLNTIGQQITALRVSR